jgi:hypothetical protein
MTTLVARGSGTPVTSGTTWASTNLAVDGAPGTNPDTAATWTNAVSVAVGYIEVTNYHTTFAAIPAGSTINSVTVKLRHMESATARFSTVRFQPYSGSTALGSIATATLAASVRDDSATFPVTLAQLQASDFKVRATATRASGTISSVFYIDHMDVTVDYTSSVVLPKVHTIMETFSAPVTNPPWYTVNGASFTGGRLSLAHPVGTASTDCVYNVSHVDATESSYFFEVIDRGNQAFTSWYGIFALTNPAQSSAVGWQMMNNTLFFANYGVGPIWGPVTYDPAAHRWLRFRTVGAMYYLDVSANGTAWNNVGSATIASLPFPITDCVLFFRATTDAVEANATTFLIDNLNSVPAVIGGKPKVWNGSAWVEKPMKVWTGSAWVEKPVKFWNGSGWVLA